MLNLLVAALTLTHPLPALRPVPALSTAVSFDEGLPAKAPSAVGMSASRLATIDRVVERGIKAGGYPGAAVVVGRKGATVWEKGFGHLGWTPEASNVDAERTIYDLASLTKVVGTTTAVMILFDEGKLHLDDRVVQYVPGFTGGEKDNVTIRQLLTHRSGLPAGRDLWRIAHTPEEARATVISTPLVAAPGQFFEYSDLGADMLGFVVEAASGLPLDRFLQARVFMPLGMNETRFRPDASLRGRIAPTEVTPPRGYPLRGEVHDENAYALGGVAGHAGIFSTASNLAIFAQMMLNGGTFNGTRIVADSTVQLFTRRAGVGSRGLGWDTCSGSYGCGKYMGTEAYGHTGYTGTSLWIDPDRDMFVILLTNRVHAAKALRPAKVISDVRADLADAAALAVTDGSVRKVSMPRSFRSDKAVGWNAPERAARGRAAAKKKTVTKKKATAKKSTARKSTTKKSTAKRSSTSVKKPASSVKKPASSVKTASSSVKRASTAVRKASSSANKPTPVVRKASSTTKKSSAHTTSARKG